MQIQKVIHEAFFNEFKPFFGLINKDDFESAVTAIISLSYEKFSQYQPIDVQPTNSFSEREIQVEESFSTLKIFNQTIGIPETKTDRIFRNR